MSIYRILADLVVVVHAAYVAFVVCGLVVTWIGAVMVVGFQVRHLPGDFASDQPLVGAKGRCRYPVRNEPLLRGPCMPPQG